MDLTMNEIDLMHHSHHSIDIMVAKRSIAGLGGCQLIMTLMQLDTEIATLKLDAMCDT